MKPLPVDSNHGSAKYLRRCMWEVSSAAEAVGEGREVATVLPGIKPLRGQKRWGGREAENGENRGRPKQTGKEAA